MEKNEQVEHLNKLKREREQNESMPKITMLKRG